MFYLFAFSLYKEKNAGRDGVALEKASCAFVLCLCVDM